ncbi:MAG: phosphoglycerate kinase [Candidatus Thermoplasmatota archaeon]
MTTQLPFCTLGDFDLTGKAVLLRVDINSPINPSTGDILDDSRMRSHVPTIRELRGSKLVILAHQSKPGKSDFTTLSKHAERLSGILGMEVHFAEGLFDRRVLERIKQMEEGEILLLENTRFFAEDVALKDKEPKAQAKSHIVRNLASVSQFFVNDAFAAAHRSQPTIVGLAEALPSLAGRLMEKEVRMLSRVLHDAQRPSIVVLGGAKVDDSIAVMEHFLAHGISDEVLTTGVVANIFLSAEGVDLGPPSTEFLEKDVPEWRRLVEKARALLAAHRDRILVPSDVAVNDSGRRVNVKVEALPSKYPIHDIGSATIATYAAEIDGAGTVVLNGPAGVFEIDNFSLGTREIFSAVAGCRGFTVVGGGHTSAVVEQMGIEHMLSHVSTGGGALINFLTGKPLPAIEALVRSKQKFFKGARGGVDYK